MQIESGLKTGREGDLIDVISQIDIRVKNTKEMDNEGGHGSGNEESVGWAEGAGREEETALLVGG